MVNVAAVNVLAGLGTTTWTVPRAVAYETVLEGVRQAIGFYSQLIAAEELSDAPDTDTIEIWRAEQLAWTKRGQELTPLDSRAIDSIHQDADNLLAVGDDDEDDDDEDSDDEDPDGEDDEADDETNDEAQGRP
ncbi:hypothetical protein AB0L70_23645 [Kribbella sp. NPDC051952]|uniref:hypothetical protein n=1 Tax=Kribbella sp. NPDC051952 TaxID=3154851 RepID=UPI00342055DD